MTMFGLLTASTVDDVPKILQRVAQGYRGNESSDKHNYIWPIIADEFHNYAWTLKGIIDEAKKHPPPRKRILLEE